MGDTHHEGAQVWQVSTKDHTAGFHLPAPTRLMYKGNESYLLYSPAAQPSGFVTQLE